MKLTTTIFSILVIGFSGLSQLTATTSTQVNTNCNGTDCNYSGPSILINELMISPSVNDGSMSGPGGAESGRGEWIELYNPNICDPIDISCYYLGNNTPEGAGGFIIPAGTIIPPAGFCMIRGFNAAPVPTNLLVQNGGNVVEIVVPVNLGVPGVCTSSNSVLSRLWFPNAGGWFAFYDSNGVPQDAVSWLGADNSNGQPCIPPPVAGCINVGSLPSYNNIPANRKNHLSNIVGSLALGVSARRLTDGGNWGGQAAPTYAVCNSTCVAPGVSTCTGTATVNVTGGTPPYTYAWDDSFSQTSQTATALCAGTYNVTVTDNTGATAVFQATVADFIPTVSVDLPTEICINANPVGITANPVATAGQTGTLTGNGVNAANFNPTTAGAGNHTVTYSFQDEFGCSNTATDVITVNPLPVVSITNNQSPYCTTATANLVLTPAGGQLTGTGVTNNQFSPAQAGAGTFTLTYVFQDTNGCSNSTTVNVQVTGPAPATLTIPSDLCIDSDTVTMIANPTGGSFLINGVASSNLFIAPNEGVGSHSIGYSVTDNNGCTSAAIGTIIVHALPQLQIPLNTPYCFETGFHPVSPSPAGGALTGTHVIGNGINVNGVAPGTYDLSYTYTDQFGCSSQLDASYDVTSPVIPNYTYETDCFQGAVLKASGINPNYTYHWNIENIYQATGSVYSLLIAEPGNYNVDFTLIDNYGCTYDTTGLLVIEEGVKIEELSVANIITPNGDGINDWLTLPDLMTDCFTYEILIVNRWGNLVFKMDSQDSKFFDGHSQNGGELAEGVYFYHIQSDDFDCDDEKYKGFCYGNITIVR